MHFCDMSIAAVKWEKGCLVYGSWSMTPEFYEGTTSKSEPSNYLGIPLEYHKNSSADWSEFAANLRDKSFK